MPLKATSLESGSRWLMVHGWLESFVELENRHDGNRGAEKGYDCDLTRCQLCLQFVSGMGRVELNPTQMCAKYTLLDVAQYIPTASVISVAARRMSITTGN